MDCNVQGGICQAHEDPATCPFHTPQVSAQEVRSEAPDALPFSGPSNDQQTLVHVIEQVKRSVGEAVNPPAVEVPVLQVIGPLPSKAYSTDAGFDLPASDLMYLSPHEVRAVPTGIRVKIPKGYFGRIVPRSSAAKRGIEVIDGTIDAGYTGELFVMAKATSDLCGELMVSPGQRIGQLLLFPVVQFEVMGVEAFVIADGDRGENGFGSSGL